MRKLHQQQESSLDLLLDTLTNVFGGIILIACLLALLARDAPPPPEASKTQSELLTVSYQNALKELQQVQQRVQQLEEYNQRSKRTELNATLTKLTAQLAAIQQSEKENAESAILSQQGQKKAKNNLATIKEDIQNTIGEIDQNNKTQTELQEKINALKTDQKKLAHELEQLPEKASEELRYPREHSTSQNAEYIVLQHGKIYPCFQEGAVSEHMDVEALPGLTRMKPNPLRGIVPADIKNIQSLLKEFQERNFYCAIELHRDSYDTFRKLKPLLLKAGIDYGINLSDASVISFGSGGVGPPPPL